MIWWIGKLSLCMKNLQCLLNVIWFGEMVSGYLLSLKLCTKWGMRLVDLKRILSTLLCSSNLEIIEHFLVCEILHKYSIECDG